MKRAVFSALMGLLLVGCAKEEVPTLKMVTEATFPPYEFLRGRQIVGVDVELGKAIAAKSAKLFKVESVNFDAIMPSLVSGKADFAAAGLTITEDRRQSVDFSIPYMKTGLVIIFRAAKPYLTLGDCRGARIGVQGGTTADELTVGTLKQQPERFASYPEACAALKSGRCDLVLCDAILAKNCIVNEPDLKLSDFVSSEEYAIAVRKGDAALLKLVNETIAEAKADGRLEQWVVDFTAEADALKGK